MHLFCKSTASKVRQRHEWQEKYGVLGSPFKTSRARRGALFCRSGTWLEILGEAPENSIERETIRGSSTENTQYGILDFISVAIGLISIRGVQSNRFLCMNSEGSLYSTPISNYSSECIFMEEMMENYYNLYSSCTYGSRKRPWYVALRRTGIPRKGKNTRRRRKASHFLVIHYDRTSIAQNYISEGQYGFSRRLLSNLRQQSLMKLRKKYQKNLKIPSSSTNAQQLPTVPKGSNLNQKRKNRKKIKSRREERLLQEELRRQQRREDIRRLREEELKRNKDRLYGEALHRSSHAIPSAVTLPSSASYPASLSKNSPPVYVPPRISSGAVSTTPRLSGAGLQIRPRRISLTTTTTSAFSRTHNL
ncbi:unnamed protein product [Auanema sp. JU1783]|nr:unnamed protein product [Auanema sp. JU1783]